MNKLPAITGWLWIKQGFHYFRQQPKEFSALFIVFLLFLLFLGSIPFAGQVLPFLFLPLFTLAFMQGCKEIDQGNRVQLKLLLTGFRSRNTVTLMQLGLLYLVLGAAAMATSTLVDDGLFWKAYSGQIEINEKTLAGTNMAAAMFTFMLINISGQLACWFAGPLIAWHEMPLFKAVFYSFFAVLKTLRIFLVYGLCWFTLAGVMPVMFSQAIAGITGNQNLMILILMPISMVLTIILYCTFYPSYKSIFTQTAGTPSSTIS